ncbi:MAG: HpcH/HpaI aldolase/citrate lyase family protein [Gaiellaceae bacterium]
MIDWNDRTLRSLLFAPGNHPRRLEKVGTFGSDSIVLDLEDAVADAEKDGARQTVRDAVPTYNEATIVMVRVNSHETGRMEEDAVAVVCADVDCLMVPKVEIPETLPRMDALLYALERERGLEVGSVRLLPLVETAKGLVRVDEIAAAAPPRVLTLAFGLGDFSTDIQVDLTQDATELLYARQRIIVAARSVGMRAPIDGPYLDIQNLQGLEEETRLSRQLGFEGRVVIHPKHVDSVQRVYAELSDEDAAHAAKVIEAFEQAEADGLASIQVEGMFVDYPIYDRARQKLRLHEAARADKVQ